MLKNKTKKSAFNIEINIGGFSLTEKVLFAKNMAVMIKSGLTISDALDITADSMSGKFKKIIKRIQESVESGNKFSDSLKEYPKIFPPLFISAVFAGETSGSLEENLEHASEQMRKEKELSGKIKGAMLYPIVVLIATFALGMAISFFVLPQITPLFEGLNVKLPVTTRGLIWFSHLVQNHGFILFGGAIIFLVGLVYITRQKFSYPTTHWLLLNSPVIKQLVRNANIARFCRTLGTLLKSGLTISEAVGITNSSLDNYYYKKAVSDVADRLGSGTPLSEHLKRHENLFPKLVTRMIHVGEQSGKLEDSLYYLASFYEEEVDNSAKTMATAIEPVLLIGIGLVVGFLALSIITPIYSITGNLK
ncbi:MAG: type II secretion system F family protein [Parcubacteria group bacterium]|nr:type II secretion system F family protein [Parcubacteria group bacterium]